MPDAVSKVDGKLYLVEHDTGTETLAQLEAKFRNYDCFDFAYGLLLVAETEKRLRKLAAVASRTVPEVMAKPMCEIRGETEGPGRGRDGSRT